VRRAIAFIEQHPDADIGVADIAAAANVSIRAVQFAFRRHLDTTPMDYLRTVRLDRAHHDLLTTNPSLGDTIAARWGFHHHSRSAARYRHAYGVTPRHTLGTRLGDRRPTPAFVFRLVNHQVDVHGPRGGRRRVPQCRHVAADGARREQPADDPQPRHHAVRSHASRDSEPPRHHRGGDP